MKNIYAHTNGAQIPGYVSINEESDGRVTMSLRSNGAQVPSWIDMPRDELQNMVDRVSAYLAATVPAPADEK